MVRTKRSKFNPVLAPTKARNWEAYAAFNGSVAKDGPNVYHMVYRAISHNQLFLGQRMHVSSVGYAFSGDGVHWKRRQQLLMPDTDFDKYGCEDPRITKIGDTYYILYTALSNWPPNKDGIHIGVAVTKDFKTIEKHPVTHFNAKAGVLFPQQINGKYVMALTAHTDMPPSKIAIAEFDRIEQMWDRAYWDEWYAHLERHVVEIAHTEKDQVEIGAVPVETPDGWLMLIGFVQNYFSDSKMFRIDAVLFDKNDPHTVVGQTTDPILVPEEEYEIYGTVPNVIFPSSALIEEGQLHIYYGATDTTVARASVTLRDLLDELMHSASRDGGKCHRYDVMLTRFDGNPILSPIKEHAWESKYTFNAGAIYLENKVHILYRAMGDDDTSVLGYASSRDGVNVDERFSEPIYVPREPFEMKYHPGFSGCEDPRLTVVGDQVYMCYTAYDGIHNPRVALSTIPIFDFVNQQWNWTTPVLISAPGVDNKDSCILPDKMGGSYVVFHRITPNIWVDFVSHLDFGHGQWLGGHMLMGPRPGSWDSDKIGLNGPPEKTEEGWLLLYHGVSKYDNKYRMGAALLDLNNPLRVLARLHNPILEPDMWYENDGYRPGTVFSNGQVIKGGVLYVYYGAGDTHTAVASIPMRELLDALKSGE